MFIRLFQHPTFYYQQSIINNSSSQNNNHIRCAIFFLAQNCLLWIMSLCSRFLLFLFSDQSIRIHLDAMHAWWMLHIIIITSFYCPFVLVLEKILKVPFLIKLTPNRKGIHSKIQIFAFIYSSTDFMVYGSPKYCIPAMNIYDGKPKSMIFFHAILGNEYFISSKETCSVDNCLKSQIVKQKRGKKKHFNRKCK